MSPRSAWLLVNEIVPRLKSAVPQVAHCVGHEDAGELVQDTTAMAARILNNAERKGKKITPGNAAYYAIQHCKSGRRFTGNSRSDVMAAGTQIAGRTRLTSLEEVAAGSVDSGEEIFLFHDVLSNDHEDPATRAARKMDWEEFVAALPEREQKMIEFMIEGKTLGKAAHALRVSDSTMQISKRNLAVNILNYVGPQILDDIKRLPRWKQDIETTREKMACREERRHL
jgi:hypothetical protein